MSHRSTQKAPNTRVYGREYLVDYRGLRKVFFLKVGLVDGRLSHHTIATALRGGPAKYQAARVR